MLRGSEREKTVRLRCVMLRGVVLYRYRFSMKGKTFMLIVITIYAVIMTVLFILFLNA